MSQVHHSELDPAAVGSIEKWMNSPIDTVMKAEIQELIDQDPSAANDAFYTSMEFGTGGIRGIVGPGPNRMNIYTVGMATQGLSNYLLKQFNSKKNVRVIIGYDSRVHSRLFAEQAARVLAGNGVEVLIFKELRPTPLVSYGCREKQCQAAIVITASHNPPEYNGYKVYWSDGGQIVPPHDRGIIEEVGKIDDFSLIQEDPLESPRIQWIGDEIDNSYLKAMRTLQHYPSLNQKRGGDLHVIYTSLHGTGATLVPKLLDAWGFKHVDLVGIQCSPDGTFPTTKSPNPEEREALSLGVKQLETSGADILLATDPDADRVGLAIRHRGRTEIMTGNQIACVCLDHICQALESSHSFPERSAFVKTIVTTELFRKIAESYQKPCFDVLTGFKYIAEMIHTWEQNPKNGHQFIFGGEESYGYLLGTYARDKDAVISSALICECALKAKIEGKTLIDLLQDIYQRYGIYREGLLSLKFPDTKEGREAMRSAMIRLRESASRQILGSEVVHVEDYLKGGALPKSNVVALHLADGGKLIVRPSGTEPKVKIYVGVQEEASDPIEAAIQKADARVNALQEEMRKLLMS